MPNQHPVGGSASARERVLAAAYELFRKQGTRDVGIDAIVARSGVAKMTLYRHFRSKEALVAAFMRRHEEMWVTGWLKATVLKRASKPADRLLLIFDVFDRWFGAKAFDGCVFIKALVESPKGTRAGKDARAYLANTRTFLAELAAAAGIKDVHTFAAKWHIMMKGSIIAACEGDKAAAREIKEVAQIYLAAQLPSRRPAKKRAKG